MTNGLIGKARVKIYVSNIFVQCERISTGGKMRNVGGEVESLLPVLPKIVSKRLTNYSGDTSWSFHFYEEFSETLLNSSGEIDNDVKFKLAPYMAEGLNDFRLQLDIKGLTTLIGIFFKDREVRFYSPRLGRELFLLQELEVCKKVEGVFCKDHQALENHVNKAASLSHINFSSDVDIITKKFSLPDLLNGEEYKQLESKTHERAEELLAHMRSYKQSIFEKLSDWGLNLTANFALLRIHMLKFLAILPSLDYDKSGVEVKRILLESIRRLLIDSEKAKNLKRKGQERPLTDSAVVFFNMVFNLSKFTPPNILTFVVRYLVKLMAKRFIAGESIEKAEQSLKVLYATERDVSLDQLGELVVSNKEADNYCEEVIRLIRGFSLHVDRGAKNRAGMNRAYVSIKVSALSNDFKPHAQEYTYGKVAPRLKKILLAAKQEDVFLNIDAEHYDYRDIVFYVYRRVLLETPELQDFAKTGIVLQAYLRDAYVHLQDIISLAKERRINMPVRIVKGAYWDAETIHADAHSFDAPEFLNKEETDIHFRQLIVKILEEGKYLTLAVASHNYLDHCFAMVARETLFPSAPIVEHQCLHMTYEALSNGLSKMGVAVRNYVPVGSLLVGMAYLVRRIMENSSQVGVLTIMRSHRKTQSVDSPNKVHSSKKKKGELVRNLTMSELTTAFFNVAPLRLYVKESRDWMKCSLDRFKENVGGEYPNSFEISGDWHEIISSSGPELIIGKIRFATAKDAAMAVELANESYLNGSWAKANWIVRASVLLKAASVMVARRNDLAALICYEAGKSIPESLADVDEAVDFLNFYAREERRLNKKNPTIISRGVFAVVAPWNFPLAIPCGMATSALVAGNSVVLKSAKHTPLIAQKFVDIMHEAGVPKNVLIHLPGQGSAIGDVLIEHEYISGVVFTGSKEVGMRIAHKLGKRIVENKLFNVSFPAKVITEMGGKNAIIVTANAELDETVSGILYSSFAHSGQKCSAASRVLVDNRVKDRLLERLKEAVNDLEVAEAYKFSTTVNPVICEADKRRLRTEIEAASKEALNFGGKVIADRSKDNLPGFCVGPAVIELPAKRALQPDSYANKELFGPALHVIGFDDLDEAIKLFNNTEYALTGGIFSQSQDDIDYLVERMEVGNVYVNRSITGARVGIEPFGGFKLSGTGPKAGGTGYLSSFHLLPADEVNKSDTQIEKGNDYIFDLCKKSGLGADARLLRLKRAFSSVLLHFETIFKGVNSSNKEVISNFRDWLDGQLVGFVGEKHSNKAIPGQLSYNNYFLPREKAIVVAYNEMPGIRTLLQVLSAISVGTGVTVLARNQRSFVWWSLFIKHFEKAGISKENLNVFFPTETLLDKALKDNYLACVIVSGSDANVQDALNTVYDNSFDEKVMTSFVTPYESPDVDDFYTYLRQFCWERSLAVNTMRHGAPLNLEL